MIIATPFPGRPEPKSAFAIEIVTDPVEQEAARQRRMFADRNMNWFQQHMPEIGNTCRGKTICIAGQELFFGDDPQEVLARAKAAHPEDLGPILHFIPTERMGRIYAH